jgi:hypothetical protein
MEEFIIDISTWDNGNWTTTTFNSVEEFKEYILSIFKLPGQYRFNKDLLAVAKEEAFKFEKQDYYCSKPFMSKDYVDYWDFQKNKCRKGLIVKSGEESWFLTRDYYMWLNFLPIFDKEKTKFGFAKLRDAQYHMALYELLAELHYKHAAILKKRQIASSYFHAGKLINQLWFEEGVTLKIGAALKDYINDKGTWKFLDEYANFLNEHTAWYRPLNPKKVLMWQQKIEEKVNGRSRDKGLKGTIQGMSFEKDPTNSVGGPVKYFFHEEAGIAPKMDQTYEYIRPALKSGFVTTGLFIAAGSVGDLDQCGPLKDMINHPKANDIYAVETNLIDEKETIGLSGLFIPEQWSMPPYIDAFGNSLVEEALKALDEQFAEWKKDLTPEQYQLRISQHPRNIKEAFATRTVSKFPQHLLSHQAERIREKEYAYEFVEIFQNGQGKPEVKTTNKIPVYEFPVSKKATDKTGAVVVWERPVENPEYGMYYASIDPVGEGRTTTSESLCSIYVYKRKIEVTKVNGDEVTTYVERDKVVCAWCGRYDDINTTHERLRLIIEWYNAKTLVENNISQFINYMIGMNKQKYLVRKDEMVFLKDLGSNSTVYQEYGWKNTGRLFKDHLLSYVIEYVKEAIDEETKEDGTVVKTTYGVERIPDPMLIVEMQAYEEGLNVDRLVSFAALVAYMKILESNMGLKKRIEKDDAAKKLEKSENLFKLNKSPFRHVGNSSTVYGQKIKRNAFKNLK